MIIWQPGVTLEDVEKQVILKAFQYFQGNKTKTAQALDIAIRTLDAKIAKYEGKEPPKEVVTSIPITSEKVGSPKHRGK